LHDVVIFPRGYPLGHKIEVVMTPKKYIDSMRRGYVFLMLRYRRKREKCFRKGDILNLVSWSTWSFWKHLTFGTLHEANRQLNSKWRVVTEIAYRAWVSAIIKSHLWTPWGSRRRFERSLPTSAISLYSKLDGHDETVAIHSLYK
jgi:hypothetical protein